MLAGRSLSDELMDDPALDLATYAAVLGDLAKVNTVTMARRPTLAFLERALVGAESFRLLDVGFGDGDMLRAIARWASGRGIMAELVITLVVCLQVWTKLQPLLKVKHCLR